MTSPVPSPLGSTPWPPAQAHALASLPHSAHAPAGLDTLVIGFGNELLGDDAAGPRIVRALGQWNLPHCQSLIRHQLTPELAETISRMRCVIFVDAAIQCTAIEVRTVKPDSAPPALGHTLPPSALLGLTRALYGVDVPGWIVRVPAFGFELGAGLSAQTERSIDEASRILLGLARS
jgi:hydrogenase maturation protease